MRSTSHRVVKFAFVALLFSLATFHANAAELQESKEYTCPRDNGGTISVGGRCFELRCNFGTRTPALRVIPMTSLKGCAAACAAEPQCKACDLVVGPGAVQPPNNCVLFSQYGRLFADPSIHYWVPAAAESCPTPTPTPEPEPSDPITTPQEAFTDPVPPLTPSSSSDDSNLCAGTTYGPVLNFYAIGPHAVYNPAGTGATVTVTVTSYEATGTQSEEEPTSTE